MVIRWQHISIFQHSLHYSCGCQDDIDSSSDFLSFQSFWLGFPQCYPSSLFINSYSHLRNGHPRGPNVSNRCFLVVSSFLHLNSLPGVFYFLSLCDDFWNADRLAQGIIIFRFHNCINVVSEINDKENIFFWLENRLYNSANEMNMHSVNSIQIKKIIGKCLKNKYDRESMVIPCELWRWFGSEPCLCTNHEFY